MDPNLKIKIKQAPNRKIGVQYANSKPVLPGFLMLSRAAANFFHHIKVGQSADIIVHKMISTHIAVYSLMAL